MPSRQASNHEACDCQRGRRQGRSLKIYKFAAPPQGVIGKEHHSAESEDSGRPPHCRRPLQIRAKNASFSCLNSSITFLHATFAKSAKMDPVRTALEAQLRQNRPKRLYRHQHKKHIQKVSRKDYKTEAQHLPNQAFRFKRLHFLSSAASAEKYSK